MSTVVFSYMAYSYYQNNKKEFAVASGALAILFQPFVKLALGRCVWNFVDIIGRRFISGRSYHEI